MTQMLWLTHSRIALAAAGIVFITAADAVPAPVTPTSPHCGAAGYHQLDFWIGDWDTFETDTHGGPLVARARVESIAQGCAIHELYEQNDGTPNISASTPERSSLSPILDSATACSSNWCSHSWRRLATTKRRRRTASTPIMWSG